MTSLGTTDVAVEAWSRDGRVLLNVRHDDSQVFRINVDRNGRPTGAAGRLTKDGRVNDNPAISPDSKMVAYYSNNGTRIAIVNADGTRERQIGQPEIDRRRHLEWLPPGRLVFRTPGQNPNDVSVASFDVNTSVVEPLVAVSAVPGSVEPALRAHWQYVGVRRELFYLSNAMNGFLLCAKAIDTGVDRVVALIPNPLTSGFTFRVSPDATQIAYGKWSGMGDARHPELHVMTINGQNDRILLTSRQSGKDLDNWQPAGAPYDWLDGRILLYDEYPGRVMAINVQSGESWPIAEAPSSERVRWSNARWSADGSFIVLQRNEIKQEFLQLEGLTYENIVKLMESKK